MQTWQPRWLAVVLLGLGLCACAGGSGSSGFDVTAAEGTAIGQALATRRCVPVEETGLTVCPADVPMPDGAPGSVATGVDPASALTCVRSPGDTCAFTFSFVVRDLPSGAIYRVATRSADPIGAWHVSAAPAAHPAPDAGPALDVPVLIERPADAPSASTTIDVAVLVYLAPPASIPSTARSLADTGADFAYVAPPITVTAAP